MRITPGETWLRTEQEGIECACCEYVAYSMVARIRARECRAHQAEQCRGVRRIHPTARGSRHDPVTILQELIS